MPKAGQKKEEKGGKEDEWCYKICRCITFPDGHSTHGPLAVVPQPTGNAARRLAPVPFVKSSITAYENRTEITRKHETD